MATLESVLVTENSAVFYNPIQQFNRDLSILAIRSAASQLNRKINIFEGLAATGLRSIRYAKNIPSEILDYVEANDLDRKAVSSIESNVKLNDVADRVRVSNMDANLCMHIRRSQKILFDVIDLDPYGSAAPFLDAAVQTIKNGGMLCLTCTDLSVLAGNTSPEKCYALYGGMSATAPFCHELALRLLLHATSSAAAKYGKVIKPLLSCSIDFYLRVFVRVEHSPLRVKQNVEKTNIGFICCNCKSVFSSPMGTPKNDKRLNYNNAQGPPCRTKCQFCGGSFRLFGPFWSGDLHDLTFIKTMQDNLFSIPETLLQTSSRIKGLLCYCSQELQGVLFYHSLDDLFSIVRSCVPPRVEVLSAILNAGYKFSYSHCKANAIKTDAPMEFLFLLIRDYALNRARRTPTPKPNSPGQFILFDNPVFDEIKAKYELNWTHSNKVDNKLGYTWFQENPMSNWGPKSRPAKENKKLSIKRKSCDSLESANACRSSTD